MEFRLFQQALHHRILTVSRAFVLGSSSRQSYWSRYFLQKPRYVNYSSISTDQSQVITVLDLYTEPHDIEAGLIEIFSIAKY